jgi:hypothetical protein
LRIEKTEGFGTNLGDFPEGEAGLLPIPGLVVLGMSKKIRFVSKFGGKRCNNVQETIPGREKTEKGRRSRGPSGWFQGNLEKKPFFS